MHSCFGRWATSTFWRPRQFRLGPLCSSDVFQPWCRSAACGFQASSSKGIAERAEPANRDRDVVTRLQEFWWIKPQANPGWGARSDEIAWHESEAGGDGLDKPWDVEDQIAGVGILAKFTVDPALQLKVLRVSSAVVIQGPIGRNVSSAFPRYHWR